MKLACGIFLAAWHRGLRHRRSSGSPSPLIPPFGGTTGLDEDIQHFASPSLLRHHKLVTLIAGSGILTGYPSTTPFGLVLGSTNPGRINLPQETLDFRRYGFSP